mmetsp:Transcript_108188/g.316384  ORF Transcript_108188/g.316384 Transcript_108188/m.316384 type:complete len:469 (-) Transcript_108188:176-1582(-)
MTLSLAVLAVTSLAFLRAESLGEGDVGDGLGMDDTCMTGEDCELSLRQLRGERQNAGILQANVREQAPQFNYNWNFGCAGSDKDEAPASDGAQFNYNWNFCFDDKTRDAAAQIAGAAAGGSMKKKPGNCKVFGCTESFDFMTLTNECQCFPGCDKTFLGNTCCPDFKDQCQGSASKAPTAASEYTRYANAVCSRLHGAVEQSKHTASRQQCSMMCSRDPSCEGFGYSNRGRGRCKLLSGINIPECDTSRGKWCTYVKNSGQNPPVCSAYMAKTGCSWTAKWNCPGQARGSRGTAGNDGSQGFDCCCNLGMWRSTRPALPTGTPLKIINRYSNRALFAKKGKNWEDGVGAGTPPEKVTEDGYWTLVPQGHDEYRIVNQFSNRALYAKSSANWESGWGAGSPPSAVKEDGLWRFQEDEEGGVRIINVKSGRALYAKTGGAGEMSWSGGVGAGSPKRKVTKDGMWTLDFVH